MKTPSTTNRILTMCGLAILAAVSLGSCFFEFLFATRGVVTGDEFIRILAVMDAVLVDGANGIKDPLELLPLRRALAFLDEQLRRQSIALGIGVTPALMLRWERTYNAFLLLFSQIENQDFLDNYVIADGAVLPIDHPSLVTERADREFNEWLTDRVDEALEDIGFDKSMGFGKVSHCCGGACAGSKLN